MEPVVCIVGPTASGKTALSIALARAFDGEIISADSMQIYRGMDIGTAKPSPAERAGIPHHMLDVADPEEDYSVARYVEEASRAIADIHLRGKLPIVAGGTGLYVDSLLRGMDFAESPGDAVLRRALAERAQREGSGELYAELARVDPEQAARLHINDTKRIIRALEVFYATGERLSEHNRRTREYPARYRAAVIGLTYADRALLYGRIEARVDQMLEDGLVDELRTLLGRGVPESATSMQAIGYKELRPYLAGEKSLAEAAADLKQATRRYAKRQITWFRRNPDIRWFTVDNMENITELLHASTSFLHSCGIIECEK